MSIVPLVSIFPLVSLVSVWPYKFVPLSCCCHWM